MKSKWIRPEDFDFDKHKEFDCFIEIDGIVKKAKFGTGGFSFQHGFCGRLVPTNIMLIKTPKSPNAKKEVKEKKMIKKETLKNMKQFKHELGLKAKDKITGFTGILTARCEFLTGCNRYCIQPTELKDGSPLDSIYFDEAQIEIVGDGILASSVQGEDRGACSPDASK